MLLNNIISASIFIKSAVQVDQDKKKGTTQGQFKLKISQLVFSEVRIPGQENGRRK